MAENTTNKQEPSLFGGLLDDVYTPTNTIDKTDKTKLLTDGSVVPEPKNKDSGTPFETNIPTLSNREVDPQTESSLKSNKVDFSSINGIINNLTKNFGIPLNAESFAGRTTPFSLSELEKKVLPKVKNLETNFNPLNFKPESFLSGLNLVEQLIQELGHDNGAEEEAQKRAEDFDAARLEIYNINGKVEKLIPEVVKIVSDKISTFTENDSQILKNYLYKFETIYTAGEVIQHGTTKDQLMDLKAFLNSLAIVLTKYKFIDLREKIMKIYLELSEIMAVRNNLFIIMLEDITKLLPSLGPFNPLGIDQYVDYQFGSDDTAYKNLDFYSWLRRNYVSSSHSSVSKLATSFMNKGKSLRDIVDLAEWEAPRDAKMASSGDGSGDKVQKDKKIDTVPYPSSAKGTVGPLNEEQFEKYKSALGKRESGNDYSKVNTIGFSGRWQFGAEALIDLGYVRAGSSTRGLGSDSAWTGKDGISSRQKFLSNNNSCQDKCILEYTRKNYKGLLRANVINEGSPADEVGGYLFAAHLKGVGGAKKLKNGQDNKDAYGTTASSYYQLGKSAINGGKVDTSVKGAKASQTNADAVGKTTVPDTAAINPPSSQATPRYPYNSVKEFEGGHFKEYDSTPGNERIQERHKTGTGYEIMSDGTFRKHVTSDRYTVIMGTDYLVVSGNVQISVKGDVGIRADGSINLDAGKDLNINVAGDVNWKTNGNHSQNIEGSKRTSVTGDSAENVSGFKKVGITGDLQVEGASVSQIARDGDMNFASKKTVNMKSVGDVTIQTAGNYTQNIKGKTTQTSEGESSYSSKGNMMISSTGGTASLAANGQTNVSSEGGNINLHGSGLAVNSQIEKAIYANKASIASAIGPAPPEPGTGTKTEPAKTEQASSEKVVSDEKKIAMTVDKFHPVVGDKTQGYAGGEDMSGYSKGIPEASA